VRLSDDYYKFLDRKTLMGQKSSRIKVEYGTDVTFVTFLDERIVDDGQIIELRKSLEPVIEKNEAGKLILNFCNVSFMTSALLGLLVRVHKRVCESGGRLQLSNLDENLQRIFEITQLTRAFDIT
jgi:anti-sigma B factor antagonist